MIWLRLVTFLISFLIGIYYIMLVIQLYGGIKFTNRKFTFLRCIIPFYYWLMPQEENKKTKN